MSSHQRNKRYRRLRDAACALYPTVFDRNNPKLLAIGTREVLVAHGMQPSHAAEFLRRWTCRWEYLVAAQSADSRHAIDGTPMPLSETHREWYRRRHANWVARRTNAPPAHGESK